MAAKKKYYGPDYTNCIIIGSKKFHPKNFTAKQRDQFLKEYPRYQYWWEPPKANSEEE